MITVGKTITALLAGLAFVHLDFPAKWWVFWFVLVTLMMPTEISIIALFQTVSGFGWGNSMYDLTIPFLASATVEAHEAPSVVGSRLDEGNISRLGERMPKRSGTGG